MARKQNSEEISIIQLLKYILAIIILFIFSWIINNWELVLAILGVGLAINIILEFKFKIGIYNSFIKSDFSNKISFWTKTGNNSKITNVGVQNVYGSKESAKTKLETYFDENETYIKAFVENDNKNGLFLHAMVKNLSENIAKNCYAKLVEINKLTNGKYEKITPFTIGLDLHWAHENLPKKDIDPLSPRRLDVCYSEQGNTYFSFFTEKFPRGIPTDFGVGKYKIKVKIVGDNFESIEKIFYISFDRDWKTLKMSEKDFNSS